MKACGGRADIAQIILKQGPPCRGMLSFRPLSLYPGISAVDIYRIGDRVYPKTVRIFRENITLESNHCSFVFQFIALSRY